MLAGSCSAPQLCDSAAAAGGQGDSVLVPLVGQEKGAHGDRGGISACSYRQERKPGAVVPHGPACMAQGIRGKPHVPTGLRWDWQGSGGGTLSSAPPGPRCRRRRPEET